MPLIHLAGKAGHYGDADADARSPAGRRSADGIERARGGPAGARRYSQPHEAVLDLERPW